MANYLLRIIYPNKKVRSIPLTRLIAVPAEDGVTYWLLDGDTQQSVSAISQVRKGDNLILEVNQQPVVHVNNFYKPGIHADIAGASPAVTQTYTPPPAQTIEPSYQPPLPNSESNSKSWSLGGSALGGNTGMVLLGGAGLLGVAALASAGKKKDSSTDGGSNNSGGNATSSTISGTVVAGPLLSTHDLKVKLYKKLNDNTPDTANPLVGETSVDANGNFSLSTSYTGVVVAHVYGTNASNKDYKDETVGDKNLDIGLYAIGVKTGSNLTLNVNPLTTLAFNKALLTEQSVADTNTAIAKAFGLNNLNDSPALVNVSGFDASNGLSNAEKYGAALAVLSGLDHKNNSQQVTLKTLGDNITISGNTAVLNDTAQRALGDGLQDYLTNTTASKEFTLNVSSNGVSVVQNAAPSNDTTPPSVSSIALSSDATGNTLVADKKLFIDVSMSEVSKVTQSSDGKWPQLQVVIGDKTVLADFDTSTNNKNTLRFSYTIPTGSTDADGISLAANSIMMNGASVADGSGNSTSTLATDAKQSTLMVDSTVPIATLQHSVAMQLEATSYTQGSDYTPQITSIGSSGQYVVVWRGANSNGKYDVFVQRFNADGTKSGQATVFAANNKTTAADFTPEVTALGSDGSFAVSWVNYTDNREREIKVQKFDANGSLSSTTPVNIKSFEALSQNLDATPKMLATGTDGSFVLTWSAVDTAWNVTTYRPQRSIYVQKFSASGTLDGAVTKLKVMGDNSWDYNPEIALIDSSGKFVLAWEGVDSNGDKSIFVQPFNSNATANGSALMLEASNVADLTDEAPKIVAVGSSGKYVVAWAGNDSDSTHDFSIFVQLVNADNSISGNARVQLEANGKTDGDDAFVSVTALGTSGKFAVVWTGENSNGNGNSSIFVQLFNADGTRSTSQATQLNSQMNQGHAKTAAQIQALDGEGAFVVVWQDSDVESDNTIYLQRFNADGSKNGSLIDLEPPYSSSGNDSNPVITSLGSTGAFAVSWQGIDSTGHQSVFVQQFNADGTLSSANQVDQTIPNNGGVNAVSNETGTLYLVNDQLSISNFQADVTRIASGSDALYPYSWSKANANANTTAELSGKGLIPGNYQIYAMDQAGNLSAAASNKVSISAVTNVALTSATGLSNKELHTASTIQATVSLSDSVNITGTPQLSLDIGGKIVNANYKSGSGSKALIFEYTIQSGENDSDGIAIVANGLALNGGTITQAVTGGAAFNNFNFERVLDNNNYQVDNTAPKVSFERVGSITTTDNVRIYSDELGTAYLVESQVAAQVHSVADMNTLADNLWNSVNVTVAGYLDIPSTGLATDKSYKLLAADEYGNFSNAASNESITLKSTINTSIVVFDLANGVSSAHSNRTFDANTSYTIYIRANSNNANIAKTTTATNKSFDLWFGGDNLGADDKIVLVGSGAAMVGKKGGVVDAVDVKANAVSWQTAGTAHAGKLYQQGYAVFTRATGGLTAPVGISLWSGSHANLNQGKSLNAVYLTNMPAGILASQGLV